MSSEHTHASGSDTTELPGGFDPLRHPDRLNLGCGFDHRDAYLNVDFQPFHEPDLVADVRDLRILPTEHYAEILANDVLEHLPRTDTGTAVAEWFRLLRPGGTLEIRTPNILGVAQLMRRTPTLENHRLLTLNLFGTQAYTGDIHYTGFTDLTLSDHLVTAGFRSVELDPFDEWMFDAIARRPVTPSPPVAMSFGEGFYGREEDDSRLWRWCTGDAWLTILNLGDAPVDCVVECSVRTAGKGSLRIEGPGVAARLRVREGVSPLRIAMVAAPGPNPLNIRADTRPVDAPQDPRSLVLMLEDVTLSAR